MKPNWKIISIISRFTAQAISMLQTIVILKYLSVGDFGLAKLVVSIVAIIGVYQNLGISSGSTREIAAAKDKTDAFKIFLSSLMVRYTIAIPLVIALLVGASIIANNIYDKPQIASPIRIYALILFIQALQSTLNSAIQGSKKFGFLFLFQALIPIVSIIFFIYFITTYNFMGYFYAEFCFQLTSTLILLSYVLYLFKGYMSIPTKEEFIHNFKAVFAIGIYVYLIKIVFIQWQNLGNLVLAKQIDPVMLGFFAFAMVISMKLLVVSDAITDVTLPSMTAVYEKSKEQFKEIFLEGNSKSFLLVTFATLSLILLKYDLFLIIDYIFAYIGKDPITVKYEPAFRLMDPLILSFWAYSQLNLLNGGLAVPTKKLKEMLIAYVILFVSTIGFYYIIPLERPIAFGLAMVLASLISYFFVVYVIQKAVEFYPIRGVDIRYVIGSLAFLFFYYLNINPLLLFVLYCLFTGFYYVKILPKYAYHKTPD